MNEPIPDTYACQACGRRDGLDAVVPDAIWEQIRGGLNLLCLWCIDRRCLKAGVIVRASLHFAGLAITGTSQSDADQDHVSRLVTENERLRAQLQPLSAACGCPVRHAFVTYHTRTCSTERAMERLALDLPDDID